MNITEIVTIKELIGRTIVNATIWEDETNMSLLLDDGSILQISPCPDDTLCWEIERASTE